ncbi:hypothetical protein [Burkholderia sp. LMU1-1-1.1]|jgi:hypothetical protein
MSHSTTSPHAVQHGMAACAPAPAPSASRATLYARVHAQLMQLLAGMAAR